MKRFTATEKWRDPWFRKLSLRAKTLFLWLTDHCDNAGVIEPDFEAASFDIGEAVNEQHFAELESRLKRLPNGKVWLVKFIQFQYGNLSAKCIPHLRVLESLSFHGIPYPEIEPKSTTPETTLASRVETTIKKGQGQEKDKEEEEDKEKEIIQQLQTAISEMYHRKPDDAWSYGEQCLLIEVSRRRNVESECDEIEDFKAASPKFFPQSIDRLLSGWSATLDRARSHVDSKSEDKPVSILERELKAIERL